ncbi:MAG: sulfite exporter TauE/SafE family protein [Smithellaceae bacterium]|nr:sulfite exporter TauE/SafE family protein [Smithellaceae bacterium]
MDPILLSALTACIFVVAVFYSCVGHGGASGYIAVMMLFSLMPGVIKPVALVLNIIVSSVAAYEFYRAGYFRWSLFWPFACISIPLAFIGGSFTLPIAVYKPVIGMTLLFSAARLFVRPPRLKSGIRKPSLYISLFVGPLIGIASGLIGVGGGIFLSPLVILMGWAGVKETSALAALFVLVNSVAGLVGHLSVAHSIPPMAFGIAVAALAGGLAGSYIGSKRLPLMAVQRTLSLVITIAGVNMLFG